jgi:predicted ATP-dependent endonuclease of OLD family
MNKFSRIEISNWRQFRSIDIQFHDRLTVITGANGSGKSTILNLLSSHFSWKPQFSGDSLDRRQEWNDRIDYEVSKRAINRSSRLTYSDGTEGRLIVPDASTSSFVTTWQNQQNVDGLFVTSHRTPPSPTPVLTIPTSFMDIDAMLSDYISEQLKRAYPSANSTQFGKNAPSLKLKESLIAAVVFSQDTSAVRASESARFLWNGFQSALAKLLPPDLEFVRLEVEAPELYIETRSDRFPADGVSGGISALIEYVWMILIGSFQKTTYTVCFDEPENHLHPNLQRTLLPDLLEIFPNINFIVSTHSPFVVSSVPSSNVYALDFDDGKVESRLLDLENKSRGADETLRRVLGVPTMLPAWVEEQLNSIINEFSNSQNKGIALQHLIERLEESGLSGEFPATIDALTRQGEL